MANVHFNSTMVVLIIILVICLLAMSFSVYIISKLGMNSVYAQQKAETNEFSSKWSIYNTKTTVAPNTITKKATVVQKPLYPQITKTISLDNPNPVKDRRSVESFYYIPAESYCIHNTYTRRTTQPTQIYANTIGRSRASVYFV